MTPADDKSKTPEEISKEKMWKALSEKSRIDVSTLPPSDGPPATPERAAEIAKMPEFGLLEFCELTGIEKGKYSTFTVKKSGVRPTIKLNKSEWSTKQWIEIKAATIGLTLKFPCTPDNFADWHKCTCASNGVSDFPVAQGFFKALRRQERPSLVYGDVAVPSDAIIAAFAVESDPIANQSWWDERLRSATKHEGLLAARVSIGAAQRMSTWQPRFVGIWLYEKGHMGRSSVTAAIKSNFPDVDLEYL